MSVGNCISIKLSMSNYLLWKTQLWSLIESEGLTSFIDGTANEPQQFLEKADTVNPLSSEWRKTDRMLKSWLLGTMTEEVLSLVIGLKSAREVWVRLEQASAQASKDRELQLQRQLQLCLKGNDTTVAYLRRFSPSGQPAAGQIPSYGFSVPLPTKNPTPQSSNSIAKQGTFFAGPGFGNRRPMPLCQICGKFGHVAPRCWHRYDLSYKPQEITHPLAASSAHMTADGGNFKFMAPYSGNDINVGSGSLEFLSQMLHHLSPSL